MASLPKLCTVPKKRSLKSIRKYKLLQMSKEDLYNGDTINRYIFNIQIVVNFMKHNDFFQNDQVFYKINCYFLYDKII
jgi:hypothetical protein